MTNDRRTLLYLLLPSFLLPSNNGHGGKITTIGIAPEATDVQSAELEIIYCKNEKQHKKNIFFGHVQHRKHR